MNDELKRNGSGYYDPTAYKALKNIENGEVSTMEHRKGEIYEIELKRGELRYALVVSSDERAGDKFLNTISLNDNQVGRINVPIPCNGMKYADCGFVAYTAAEKLGNFVRKATDAEIEEVDKGILKSLGIKFLYDDEKAFIDDCGVEVQGLKDMLKIAEEDKAQLSIMLVDNKRLLEAEKEKYNKALEELDFIKKDNKAVYLLNEKLEEENEKLRSELKTPAETFDEERIELITERNVYKTLYEQTLEKLVAR